MRNRIFAVIAIAILAGGGLAYGTYNFMQNQPVQTVNAATQPVVVAAADLPLGAELKKEDLHGRPVPGRPGAGGRIRAAAGHRRPRHHRAARQERADPAGEAGVEGSRRRAAAGHSRGHARGVGARQRGDRRRRLRPARHARRRRRDREPDDEPADTTSKVVLANVQVLTAGTRMEQDQEKGKPMQVTVVTLLVTPEQAERLALASTEGKIQLALRNPLDQGAPATPGIKPAVLLGVAQGGRSQRDRVASRARRARPAGP